MPWPSDLPVLLEARRFNLVATCRSAGYRYGYHEYLLLSARDRLERLHARHALELWCS